MKPGQRARGPSLTSVTAHVSSISFAPGDGLQHEPRKSAGVAADLRGVNRLTIAGIAGVVDLVEAMHRNIPGARGLLAEPKRDRTTGIARLVYRGIQGVVGLVGNGLDLLLAQLEPLLGERSDWPGRGALLAALNGVLGDYLTASGNPLAIRMRLRRHGVALQIERTALATAIPKANGKLVVLLHGLCMSDLQWKRKGHDHGASLARDLGYTPIYLNYNSGLHISANAREFSSQLESLLKCWPVPVTELVIIGHSMGGLVARSACHYAALARNEWLRHLDKIVFLGTPHHGAPLERGGNWVDVFARCEPATPRRWHGSGRSAAPASPTCGTETWSTRTGSKPRVDSSAAATPESPCRCRRTSRAMRLPRLPEGGWVISATG